MVTVAKNQIGENRIVRPRKPEDPRMLSIGQQRLWYLSQLFPDSPAYNSPFVSRLHGIVDLAAFERALDSVIQRHEILRTAILVSKGVPVPLVLKKRPPDLKYLDFRGFSENQREAETHRLIWQESTRPFNFSRDPLFRAILFRLSNDEHIFFHVTPHIVFEGGSVGVLYRDLAAFYNGFVSGKNLEPPPLPFQYTDFAAWQRGSLSETRSEKLRKYWQDKLAGALTLNLPLDFTRPAIPTMRGARRFFSIGPELLSAANSFFESAGTTPYRGLCAAFNVFLHCYSGQTDISLGSPFAPRCRGIEELIGFFVNTVVLRTDLSGDPTFRKVIRKVDVVVHGVIAHSDLTFDKIVEAVHPPQDLSRSPLFQVNFRAPSQPYPALQLDVVSASPAEYVDNGTAKFDLALEIESSTGRDCYIEYSTDLFKPETVVQMEEDFKNLLNALIAEPDTRLSDVSEVAAISRRIRKETGAVPR